MLEPVVGSGEHRPQFVPYDLLVVHKSDTKQSGEDIARVVGADVDQAVGQEQADEEAQVRVRSGQAETHFARRLYRRDVGRVEAGAASGNGERKI